MAKRIDDNHKMIVDGLRQVGATVQSLAALGKGAPDIAVGRHGVNYFFEIKNPNMPKSKQRLTDAEQEWHYGWRGQVCVVSTLEHALQIIGASPTP